MGKEHIWTPPLPSKYDRTTPTVYERLFDTAGYVLQTAGPLHAHARTSTFISWDTNRRTSPKLAVGAWLTRPFIDRSSIDIGYVAMSADDGMISANMKLRRNGSDCRHNQVDKFLLDMFDKYYEPAPISERTIVLFDESPAQFLQKKIKF